MDHTTSNFKRYALYFLVLVIAEAVISTLALLYNARTQFKILKYQILLVANVILIFGSRFLWKQLASTLLGATHPLWCSRCWKCLLFIFLAMSHLSTLSSFYVGKEPNTLIVSLWVCLGAYIFLVLFLLTFRLVCNIVNSLKRDSNNSCNPQPCIVARISVIITLLFTWNAYLTASSPPIIIRESVPIAKLPLSMNGTRIALISDIHLGPTVGYSILKRVVDKTNSLRPDLVVLAGDLTDGSVADLKEAASALTDLVAPGGLYFTTGNHEYLSADVDNWLNYLQKIGFNVLHNSNVKVHSKSGRDWFCLVGTDDWEAGRFSYNDHVMNLTKAWQGCDSEHAAVLVTHQPKAAKLALDSKFPIQLVLSGHTHGGQFFPATILIYFGNPYLTGLYQYDKTSYVYVTQGSVYYGFPLRLGTHCEITEITLLSS